jgi:hypothetical protein
LEAKRSIKRCGRSVRSVESQLSEAFGNEEACLRRIAPNGLVEELERRLIVAQFNSRSGTVIEGSGVDSPKRASFPQECHQDNHEPAPDQQQPGPRNLR